MASGLNLGGEFLRFFRRDPAGNEIDTAGPIGPAKRDFVALGITAAAVILFVGTGGPVLAEIARSYRGLGIGPDKVAINAVILNVALIIFAWRRYRQLQDEVLVRRHAEEHARFLAETDPLTGCLNRRSIVPAMEDLAGQSKARGEIIAFLIIDLDNFKQVNDFHGHTAGDIMLQESARRIGAILPAGSKLARMGGDEFACVVPFPSGRADRIDAIATRIIDSLSRPVQLSETSISATVSIGITRSDLKRVIDVPGEDAQALLHMADIAMYHAKREGKNRFFWFEAPMESELRLRSELEAGIRRGVLIGEFVPYYEQQVDLITGKLTGFEMLARWNSPALGVVSPEIFIPVAEEIGLISELSEALIAQALRDAKLWDASLTLSVNISPIQLRDPWFSQKLLKLLVTENFPPHRLEIEITETCLHENVGVVRTLITSLKNQGIRVSLDDFGTGYSSLAQLRSLPFDQIKIDRSFVIDMHENSDSETIVLAMTALGRGLGLPVTVEGIETQAVLDKLRDYGKLKGQGYLYGRPETAERTHARLAELGLLASGASDPASESAAEMPLRAHGTAA